MQDMDTIPASDASGKAERVRLFNDWDALSGGADLRLLAETPDAPDGLTLGKPVQVFRTGPLFSRFSGKQMDDITDGFLDELVRVFNLGEQIVPVDWGHNSGGCFSTPTPEDGGLLGRIVSLEHIQGRGLWAVPAYTERGAELVRENEGLIYTSPEFFRGVVFSRGETVPTGDPTIIGRGQLLAVALTPRPAQDSLELVKLSESTPTTTFAFTAPAPSRQGGNMPDPKGTNIAPPKGVDVVQLTEELGRLRQKNKDLTASVTSLTEERDAAKTISDTAANKVQALSEQIGKLTSQFEASEKAVTEERRARKLDEMISLGKIAFVEREDAAKVLEYSEKTGHDLFSTLYASRERGSAMPLSEAGHHTGKTPGKQKTASEQLDAKITAYAEKHNIQYVQALDAVKLADPALWTQTQKEAMPS